jgi:dihydrodipicolinate synthase/N-acetylneuraminate lyase
LLPGTIRTSNSIERKTTNMENELQGIFTPNMVPLDDAGNINEDELRRYIDWLIGSGVQGLYPNGSTGEFLRFTADERRQITRIVCEQCHGRVPVLAGAAEANVRETLRACEVYADYGARAVAIVSPYYYRLRPSSVYAYFHAIASQSPIDVTLYNIPLFATPIDIETIKRLAELPRVVGIKDSSGDIAFMLRMMAELKPVRPDFAFMTGWDAALLPMLMIGCTGATLASSGVVPEVTRRLHDLITNGQYDAARPLQLELTRLFDLLITGDEFPEGFRSAVRHRGFKMGQSRQPQVPDHRAINPDVIATHLTALLASAK